MVSLAGNEAVDKEPEQKKWESGSNYSTPSETSVETSDGARPLRKVSPKKARRNKSKKANQELTEKATKTRKPKTTKKNDGKKMSEIGQENGKAKTTHNAISRSKKRPRELDPGKPRSKRPQRQATQDILSASNSGHKIAVESSEELSNTKRRGKPTNRKRKTATAKKPAGKPNRANEMVQCSILDCTRLCHETETVCWAHNRNNLCQWPGCCGFKWVRFGSGIKFCRDHDHKVQRCLFPGCVKGTEKEKTDFCRLHGAHGKTDILLGRCAQKECRTVDCRLHSGRGKAMCAMKGCLLLSSRRHKYCWAHSKRRCSTKGCKRDVAPPGIGCLLHGGGKRCLMVGCNRVARGGAWLCRRHHIDELELTYKVRKIRYPTWAVHHNTELAQFPPSHDQDFPADDPDFWFGGAAAGFAERPIVIPTEASPPNEKHSSS